MTSSINAVLLSDDAAKYLSVPFDNDRQFKKASELVCSRYFERGALCSAVVPFNGFTYVSVLKDAPVGWKTSANTRLTLSEFINMCSHLSSNKNWLSTNGVISHDVITYTGKSFNPCNIEKSFSKGLLYSAQSLLEKSFAKKSTAKADAKAYEIRESMPMLPLILVGAHNMASSYDLSPTTAFLAVAARRTQPLTTLAGVSLAVSSSTTKIGTIIRNCLVWLILPLRRSHQLTPMTKG